MGLAWAWPLNLLLSNIDIEIMTDNTKETRLEEFEAYFPLPEWLDEAIEKYKQKLEFTNLEQKLKEKKERMDLKSINAQVFCANIQDKVRKILDRYGVILELYPHYMTFAFKLNKILMRFRPSIHPWPEDYYRELKILSQTWVSKGLKKEILKDIARTFNCDEMVQILDQI